MKRISFILAVITAFTLAYGCISCSCGSGKYYIKDNNGYNWVTNTYTEYDGCVTFTPIGDGEKQVKVCGNYTIRENSSYKPEDQK